MAPGRGQGGVREGVPGVRGYIAVLLSSPSRTLYPRTSGIQPTVPPWAPQGPHPMVVYPEAGAGCRRGPPESIPLRGYVGMGKGMDGGGGGIGYCTLGYSHTIT